MKLHVEPSHMCDRGAPYGWHVQWMDAQPRINNESFFGEWVMNECMHDLNFKCVSFTIAHEDDLPT